MPTIGGFVETYKTLGKRVIVTSPLEWDGIPLASLVPIQFMGTSNYEFYGPTIPKMFALTQEGEFTEAMKLFWKIHPARLANLQAMSAAGRLQLSPSDALEISGLAAGLQWRPAAAAHDAPGGSAVAAAAQPPSTNADSIHGPSRTAISLSAATRPETSIAMLLLNAREVERLADMPRLVTAVEAGVREQAAGQVVLPPRLNLPNGRGFFRLMPTVMNGSGIMGFKAFHGSVQDGVRYFIAIYEQASGMLLAMMDAHYLTAARTGATTGVATRFMANHDAAARGSDRFGT